MFQIPVIKKAKEMGLYVGVSDINHDAVAFPYADETFVCSIKDRDGIMEISRRFKPDGILTGACDTSVVTAAYVCNQLGLPSISEETALLATNKLEMLRAFEKEDVAHPQYQLVRKSEIDGFDMQVSYPAISKPIDSSGSRGINYIASADELSKAVKDSSLAGTSGDVIIEEYMRGPEVSVEVLVVEGKPHILQITDKMTSGKPDFFETGHTQPSVLPADIKEQIRDLASRAAVAMKIMNSPVHVEIKVTDSGVKMVELGARLGGDWITSHLINLSVSGINMVESAIKLAMGTPLGAIEYENSGIYSCVNFVLSEGGIIEEILGLEKARAIEGVFEVGITATVGKYYPRVCDNATRIGYVISKGDTLEEAKMICRQALECIVIRYK